MPAWRVAWRDGDAALVSFVNARTGAIVLEHPVPAVEIRPGVQASLVYRGEAGALLGAFATILEGAQGDLQALLQAAQHPDHYRRRYVGAADYGGVHVNAPIVVHAYVLAVAGGTNSTSGLSVRGVGLARREEVDRIFMRAVRYLLPSNATFAIAREATLQAARDLGGPDRAAARALAEAWTAVGVR